jgi:hypothetical protein
VRDFFISYSGSDNAWADWIAWELEATGLEVLLQRWDFAPGSNFVHEMQRAIVDCRRLVLILSRASLTSRFVEAEWSAFFAADPTGKDRKIIPVRIDDCSPPGLLAQINYIDLGGTSEEEARTRLIHGLSATARSDQPSPA